MIDIRYLELITYSTGCTSSDSSEPGIVCVRSIEPSRQNIYCP